MPTVLQKSLIITSAGATYLLQSSSAADDQRVNVSVSTCKNLIWNDSVVATLHMRKKLVFVWWFFYRTTLW